MKNSSELAKYILETIHRSIIYCQASYSGNCRVPDTEIDRVESAAVYAVYAANLDDIERAINMLNSIDADMISTCDDDDKIFSFVCREIGNETMESQYETLTIESVNRRERK